MCRFNAVDLHYVAKNGANILILNKIFLSIDMFSLQSVSCASDENHCDVVFHENLQFSTLLLLFKPENARNVQNVFERPKETNENV